ncbi:NAD(P)-binding protein [Chloropicon primus]|uniref:NAD(P)-binding protein n=1 Tax=Chloropicon primus TaxID=1764295 RepID=A0A5B8MKK8_9CHLO|nr:NAD(P)-binding protein [Chloropicon primus]UPR00013.1 NAD(P)-binding protein [Chloropicon primus]|eukprot:QDZ20801.1 NAD(P)-binding protein [Chloropicon primus]
MATTMAMTMATGGGGVVRRAGARAAQRVRLARRPESCSRSNGAARRRSSGVDCRISDLVCRAEELRWVGETTTAKEAVVVQEKEEEELRWVGETTTAKEAVVAQEEPAVDVSLGPDSRVLVTGAGGRTGQLVLKKLAEQGISTRGLFRTEKSKKKIAKMLGADARVDLVVGDVSSAEDVKAAMEGCTHVVLLSSAKPQIKKRSLVRILVKKLFRMDPGRPSFRWIENGSPEVVDYLGGKAQIDAAVAAGVKQFVYVGSMGGTQSDNFLNTIGDGNILLWKRKAEVYLAGSGMKYTIVHPGGLLNKEGGERKLVIDVDDKILETKERSVPREDVASVVVGCLGLDEAVDTAFDLASKDPEGGSTEPLDVPSLLKTLDGKSCDYALNSEDVENLVLSQ